MPCVTGSAYEMYQPVLCLGQVDDLERSPNQAAALERADAVQRRHEADVLLGGEVLVQAEQLRHVRDLASRPTAELHRVLTQHPDLATGPAERAGEHADGRRLPRAAGTDEAEDAARLHVQR